MGKTGQTGLGLASLNSFSVLRSQGLLLVGTWPWGFLGRERVALSGSLIEEGSGLVGLPLKGALRG